MTTEQGKKIKDLREEVYSLQKQINEKEAEIDRVLIETASNFEDSYVEFYNGEEYIFMKVERQIIRDSGIKINLQGPAIRLDDNPLDEDYDMGDGIAIASYDVSDGFSFGPKVLEGHTVEQIRKISKEDMALVLDHYIDTIKKNLI